MHRNVHRLARPLRLAAIAGAILVVPACGRLADHRPTGSSIRVPLHVRGDLVESSGAAMSPDQPGVLFTINDSGNEPWLFALDTAGTDRGAWRVRGARNVDWESIAIAPCDSAARERSPCVYIGDTGDNEGRRATRVIYRVPEPRAENLAFSGELAAERLVYRYSDGPHDVEAMYVAPGGDIVLITKRALRDAGRRLRPALVFRIPASAWARSDTALAVLVDSLPIVPGSAPRRTITDAALSRDGRRLAVRTYGELFLLATDSATGRVRHEVPPMTCDVTVVDQYVGEGVTWLADSRRLLLTGEGNDTPLWIVSCPPPPPDSGQGPGASVPRVGVEVGTSSPRLASGMTVPNGE